MPNIDRRIEELQSMINQLKLGGKAKSKKTPKSKPKPKPKNRMKGGDIGRAADLTYISNTSDLPKTQNIIAQANDSHISTLANAPYPFSAGLDVSSVSVTSDLPKSMGQYFDLPLIGGRGKKKNVKKPKNTKKKPKTKK